MCAYRCVSLADIPPASQWAPNPGKQTLVKSFPDPCCQADDVLRDPIFLHVCRAPSLLHAPRLPLPSAFPLNIHSSSVAWIRFYKCGYILSIKILSSRKKPLAIAPGWPCFDLEFSYYPRLSVFLLFHYQDIDSGSSFSQCFFLNWPHSRAMESQPLVVDGGRKGRHGSLLTNWTILISLFLLYFLIQEAHPHSINSRSHSDEKGWIYMEEGVLEKGTSKSPCLAEGLIHSRSSVVRGRIEKRMDGQARWRSG